MATNVNNKKRQLPISSDTIDKECLVTTDRASRGVWLVKVPRYLSEDWQKNEGRIVGRLIRGAGPDVVFRSETSRVMPSATSSASTSGTSSANQEKANTGTKSLASLSLEPQAITRKGFNSVQLPKEHKFIMRDLNNQTMALLCEDKSGLEENAEIMTGKLSIEGRVVTKAECQPPSSSEYMKMKARQIELVSQPKNVVQQMEKAVIKFKPVTMHAEDLAKEKLKKEGVKAVRFERAHVMEMIFNAFEKHQYYKLVDLQKLTSQPISLVKDILIDIAVYNAQPPHRSTWELKPEYRNYSKDVARVVESKSKTQSNNGRNK